MTRAPCGTISHYCGCARIAERSVLETHTGVRFKPPPERLRRSFRRGGTLVSPGAGAAFRRARQQPVSDQLREQLGMSEVEDMPGGGNDDSFRSWQRRLEQVVVAARDDAIFAPLDQIESRS